MHREEGSAGKGRRALKKKRNTARTEVRPHAEGARADYKAERILAQGGAARRGQPSVENLGSFPKNRNLSDKVGICEIDSPTVAGSLPSAPKRRPECKGRTSLRAGRMTILVG